MTIQEMRELPSTELRAEIEKTREKAFKMRFQGKGKDLENPGEYKALRKDIARFYTVLRQRETAAAKAPGEKARASAKASRKKPAGGEA
jgi:large subunit ribosomal protein L29